MTPEVDKITTQLVHIVSWLRAGKENEAVRPEMYSAAAKACRKLCDGLDQLAKATASE